MTYQAKLTRNDAADIRRRHRQDGVPVIIPAHEYRVWPRSIRGIITGRSYPETITVACPDEVRAALESAAAERRGVTAEEVAAEILAGRTDAGGGG